MQDCSALFQDGALARSAVRLDVWQRILFASPDRKLAARWGIAEPRVLCSFVAAVVEERVCGSCGGAVRACFRWE